MYTNENENNSTDSRTGLSVNSGFGPNLDTRPSRVAAISDLRFSRTRPRSDGSPERARPAHGRSDYCRFFLSGDPDISRRPGQFPKDRDANPNRREVDSVRSAIQRDLEPSHLPRGNS